MEVDIGKERKEGRVGEREGGGYIELERDGERVYL